MCISPRVSSRCAKSSTPEATTSIPHDASGVVSPRRRRDARSEPFRARFGRANERAVSRASHTTTDGRARSTVASIGALLFFPFLKTQRGRDEAYTTHPPFVLPGRDVWTALFAACSLVTCDNDENGTTRATGTGGGGTTEPSANAESAGPPEMAARAPVIANADRARISRAARAVRALRQRGCERRRWQPRGRGWAGRSRRKRGRCGDRRRRRMSGSAHPRRLQSGEWRLRRQARKAARQKRGAAGTARSGSAEAAAVQAAQIPAAVPSSMTTTHLDSHSCPAMIWNGTRYYLFGTSDTLNIRSSPTSSNGATSATFSARFRLGSRRRSVRTRATCGRRTSAFSIGEFHVYYPGLPSHRTPRVIGLATNPTLDSASASYRWTDQGMVVQSVSSNDYNAIDPM